MAIEPVKDLQRFGAVLVDMPWPYAVYSKDTGHGRSAESHYRTMTWRDLRALGPLMRAVTTDNAAFCIWSSPPVTPYMFLVCWSWGLRFTTKLLTWVKLNRSGRGFMRGTGHYTGGNSEDLWLWTKRNTKGLTPNRLRKDIKQVLIQMDDDFLLGESPALITTIGRHSAKPKEAGQKVRDLFVGPYLEAFAREPVAGWTCVGNEITGNDIRVDLQLLRDRMVIPVKPKPRAPRSFRPHPEQVVQNLDRKLQIMASEDNLDHA